MEISKRQCHYLFLQTDGIVAMCRLKKGEETIGSPHLFDWLSVFTCVWMACRFYCGLFRFAFAEVGFRFGMMDQTADIFAVCDEQQYCNNTAENHQ